MEKFDQGDVWAMFGYNAKMEGYTNISSDIPELAEIPPPEYLKGSHI